MKRKKQSNTEDKQEINNDDVRTDDCILRDISEDIQSHITDDILSVIDDVNHRIASGFHGDESSNQYDNESCVHLNGEIEESINVDGEMEVSTDTTTPSDSLDDVKNDCFAKMYSALLDALQKWKNITADQIEELFSSASKLNGLTRADLDVCISAIRDFLDRKGHLIKRSWQKYRIVNLLIEIFGDKSTVKTNSKPKKQPVSLRKLCKNVISTKYPKLVLNVLYANTIFPCRWTTWENKCLIRDVLISGCENPSVWYSTPTVQDGEILFAVLDTELMLVNARVKCCKTGMPKAGACREAWVKVAKNNRNNNAGLSIAHVEDLIDRQSCAFAFATFSKKVETEMHKEGDMKEAQFCRLMREWYEAEDEAGLPQVERIRRRMNLHQWLIEDVRFDVFPPPGTHIKDIPVVLYEGLLTSIERRIQLFPFVKNGSYNVRSVGSQDVENFFGEFSDLDPKCTGVVRPDDVKTVISNVCEIYKARLDPNRCFQMRTSAARPYPVKLPTRGHTCTEEAFEEWHRPRPANIKIIVPRDHEFDDPRRRKINPKRKRSEVQLPGMPARGAQPVREHHKRDEAKILPHKRIGIEIE